MIVQSFGTKFLLRKGECKTRENSNFLKMGKNRNFGQNSEFFYILDDEMDFTVGIFSQNLINTLNFVEFRDRWNLHVFRGTKYRVP